MIDLKGKRALVIAGSRASAPRSHRLRPKIHADSKRAVSEIVDS